MNTAMIDRWHSIQLMRHLLKAGREVSPGIKGKETLDKIRENLISLRKAARPVVQTRTFVDETTARIENDTKNAVNTLMSGRYRTRYETDVGGKHAGKAGKLGSRVAFRLGYRWHDKVYLGLIKNLLNGKDILPVSAVEYRVNVPNVRLWQVKVWDFKKKQEVMGYIGQSKLNDKCIFTTTVASAIAAAERTTIKTVDEKLGIKENQNG